MYMLVTIRPIYARLGEFERLTGRLLPAYRSNGWELVGAYRVVAGDCPRYLHLWRIDDANSATDGLTGSIPPAYADDFGAVIETIASESFELLVDASYAGE